MLLCSVCVCLSSFSHSANTTVFGCLSAALRFQKALTDCAGERKRKGENPGSVMQHFHPIRQTWSIGNDLQPPNQSAAACSCRAPSVGRQRESEVQPSSSRCVGCVIISSCVRSFVSKLEPEAKLHPEICSSLRSVRRKMMKRLRRARQFCNTAAFSCCRLL